MKKKINLTESNALYTFISIILGFLVGAVLLAFAGINPGDAYGKLLNGVFGETKYIVWSIVYAAPLIFTGLSVAFSFRTGVFNIGAEGQFVVGSIAAAVCGIVLNLPPFLHALVCILAAALAGAIWGGVVGLMKIKRGINEVLSYIMFNWIAFYLSNYIVNLPGIKREQGAEATKDVADTARILMPQGVISATKCTAANWGFFMAVAAAIIIWFIISKTTLGYQLRAVGYSRTAADYGGINSSKMFMVAMAISGALSGLGGAVQVLGMGGRISQFATQEQFGFQGITVALIGASNPIGCIFAGLFYGAMKYGGNKLSMVNAPAEVVNIIMGTIIFFIAIALVFKNLFLKIGQKKRLEAALKEADSQPAAAIENGKKEDK